MSNNDESKKFLIENNSDFIDAKPYKNSIKYFMDISEGKRITNPLICKFLMLTKEELEQIESEVMTKLKQDFSEEIEDNYES